MPAYDFLSLPGRALTRATTLILALLLLAVAAVIPGSAGAATLSATPSNLSSVFSSAQAGDTIQLASGSYGRFAGGAKSGMVTLRPQSGASVSLQPNFNGAAFITLDGITTMSSINIGGASHDIAITNTAVTGPSVVNASTMSNANISFDRDTFYAIDACNTCYEGRLTVRGNNNTAPVGVSITNSRFGKGGGSDGVQIVGNAYGVKIGPGNEFANIKQGSYAAHVDSIQLYGSSHTQIVGNYFHDNDTIIMAPDGGDQEYIANNVMVGAGYAPAVQLGSHSATQFVHNTVKNMNVNMDSKSGRSSSRNGVLRDNVMVNAGFHLTGGSGCSNCTTSTNLFNTSARASGTNTVIGSPTFTGGANPTTYAGWALASGSVGKNNASDATDRGINVSGTAPTPPPTPTPTPTPTPAPVTTTAIWTAPTNVIVGKAVTLDGTASKGLPPLTCTWSFENQSGSIVWETLQGCKITKAFQNADTKYVKLTVRGKNGATSASRKSFAVTKR